MDYELLSRQESGLFKRSQLKGKSKFKAWATLIFWAFAGYFSRQRGLGLSEIHRKYMNESPITDMDISAAMRGDFD